MVEKEIVLAHTRGSPVGKLYIERDYIFKKFNRFLSVW